MASLLDTPLSVFLQVPKPEPIRDESIIALFEYRHTLVKQLIWEIKYKGHKDVARKIAPILYDTVISELEEKNIFARFPTVFIAPIPVTAEKRLTRGWNQAEIIGEALMREDNAHRFKYAPELLTKQSETASQTTSRSRRERLENLAGSMKADESKASGHFVIVIDDVTTTGATFTEARRALKEAKAAKVLCVALSH